MVRIHVMGASGSGTTSLAAALAQRLGLRHLDSDDFYWMPTDPPYTTPREITARKALLQMHACADAGWVLSGSALKWGEAIEPLYQLIVFLRLDPVVRMQRIRSRELARYGNRICEGGDMAKKSKAFLAWAESYDRAGPEQRSLVLHETWLAAQTAPILRLDTSRSTEELVEEVLRHPVLVSPGR